MTRIGALRWALSIFLLVAAACSDGPVDIPVLTDRCAEPGLALALGDTVAGTLDEGDCFSEEGRLVDSYDFVLTEPTLFRASLTTVGYFPHYPFYLDTVQVSGWANDRAQELDREHLLPAGSYELRSTSFAIGTDPSNAPRGSYTLFTAVIGMPQEGCGRETTVTYGSVAVGRITPEDCEAVLDAEPGIDRRLDGYTFLIDGPGMIVVEVSADFPYRITHYSNGQPGLQILGVPAGASRTLNIEASGFQDFYILNEEDGVGGSYTVSFTEPLP